MKPTQKDIYDLVCFAIEKNKMTDYQPISDYVATVLEMDFTEESRDRIYNAISEYNEQNDDLRG